MQKLLQEISVIPGVTGACIFDKKEGPICKLLRQDIAEEDLKTVGIHLARLVQMGAMAGLAIHSSHFRFDRYTLIGIPLNEETILVAICDAQVNCSLVSTTASMLARDMRSGQDSDQSPESDADPDAAAEDDEPFLQTFYDEIEQALIAAMGPVAILVLNDSFERWRQAGPAVVERLPELTAMLAEEIGNPELAATFTARVEELL